MGGLHLNWHLRGVPSKSVYHKLHEFLKRWPTTKHSTKGEIGKFYLAIDKNLQGKGGRPDNIYRFIERVTSATDSDEVMIYKGVTELNAMQAEVKHCTENVSTLSCQVSELKQQLEESTKQLQAAKCALRDITNEKCRLQRQRDIAERRAAKIKKLHLSLEDDFSHLLDENADLLVTIAEVENELVSEGHSCSAVGMKEFCIETKSGRRYSPAIRKLYYSLLAQQVPTSRIADIIKAVIRCFNPSIDIHNLKLPQRACASYM